MQPKYPIYIPSKGRWESRYTVRALQRINVPFKVVVEPQEFDKYAAVIDAKHLLVLPHTDKGLVATRNWIWDHAAEHGHEKYWTIDDNMQTFYRRNRNRHVPVADGTMFCVAEDFTARYENVPIAGFQYEMFVVAKHNVAKPFTLNTRVYSNMLIETEAKSASGKPYRCEGEYNDNTDLCLRVLKDGNCTILFNVFLVKKIMSMECKGGLTEKYAAEGRLKPSQELQAKHPDVTRIVKRWGRWHHFVDYRPFKNNKLIRKSAASHAAKTNDYGMKLKAARKPRRVGRDGRKKVASK